MGTTDDTDRHDSEFEDAYDADAGSARKLTETFGAELLEETLEVLEPPAPVCVARDARLDKVIAGMGARNHGAVLVVDDGVLVGIFTERDVVRRVVGQLDLEDTPVGEVMTTDPEAVSFHDTIVVALNKMTVGGFRHVPLVDISRKPVGLVSIRDVVHYFVDHFPNRVLNVAPNPLVRRPDEIVGA